MTLPAGGRLLRCLLIGMAWAHAQAGPPFRTDDPQPVDLGHVELYLFSSGQRTTGNHSGIGPALEFNAGILPDTQVHVVVPWAYDRTQGVPTQSGLGDLEVGLKYRFLHETAALPQVGVFPLVEIPTGRSEQGLGSGHTQVLLPVWVQKGWGPWTTYGGCGWWRNPGAENRNWHYAGWLVQRDLGEKVTLGAEVFRATAATVTGRASTGINVGGQVNVSEKHHVLFSVGRNVSGDRQSTFYLGYQLTAGPFGALRDWLRPGHPHT